MHKVEFYQLPKSKHWRWKILYNNRVLDRGEGAYAKRSGAVKAFEGVYAGLNVNFKKELYASKSKK